MMRRQTYSRQSGLALLTVFALLALLAVAAIAFMLTVKDETQASRNYTHMMRVKDLAAAGANVGLAKLRSDKVGPDGIPIGDPNSAGPPLTLKPDDGNGQLGRLQGLLEDANSYSGDRE